MMINEKLIGIANRVANNSPFQRMARNLRRLFPAYLFIFVPFLLFGTRNDLRLMFWKVAVVGCGLLVFHFTRKSMFPYIDLSRSLSRLKNHPTPSTAGDGAIFSALGMAVLAEAVIIGALAFAIIIAMAEGL